MVTYRALLLAGRRDLNSTAPMRGCCFIGTYAHQGTVLARIERYGTANITANKLDDARLCTLDVNEKLTLAATAARLS
jgi:hypothetical protein